MKVSYWQLLQAGFYASFAAPIVYLIITTLISVKNKHSVDVTLWPVMFVSALFFSLLLTMSLVLFSILITVLLKKKDINVAMHTVIYLIVVGVYAIVSLGLEGAGFNMIFVVSNALVLMWFCRRKMSIHETK